MCRALPLKVMSYVSVKTLQLSLQQLVWYVGRVTPAMVVWYGSNRVWVILPLLTAPGLITDDVFFSHFI